MKKIVTLLIAFAALFAVALIIFRTPDIPADELRTDYANSESEFVEVAPGLTMHMRDQGAGSAPVMILIHGSSASLHTWESWVERLSADYRIITLDLPGHGLTGPHPDACYTAQCMVAAVDAAAAAKGVDSFVIGGNSMGGWVSWNYALAHAEKVRGLILVDASGIPVPRPDEDEPIGFRVMRTPVINQIGTLITPRSMIESSLKKSVVDPAFVTDAQVDRYWHLLRHPGNRTATIDRANTPRGEPATAERLAGLTMPALVMWGEQDGLIPVEAARLFDERLPNSRLVIYGDIGHLPQEETPDRSAADVTSFLTEVYAPSPGFAPE